MKGGINKIVRNIVATKGKSEYEKRLIKATYHMDSKEPKEKHVIYIIECLRGTNPEIRPSEALNGLFSRFLKNISSWALTTKIFIIFHRCLQDPQLYAKIALELKQKEHLLHSYQKKASDQTYEAQMYADLSQMYSNYIKYLVQFMQKSQVLNLKMLDVSSKAKGMSITDLLFTYENFDALITMIFNIFEHQNFCLRTRLWQNVIFYVFTDLIRIYKVFYVMITEVLERFPSMNREQAQKSFVMYQNFVNLTNIMKSKSDSIMQEFGFHMRLPEFFKPDATLVETLRICVSDKQAGSQQSQSNIAKISQQLRGGMNRDQFQTGASSQIQGSGSSQQAQKNVHWDPYAYLDEGSQSFKFSEKQDSDSGEDYDYGDEDGGNGGEQDKNIDLLDYISNMDISNIQQQQNAAGTTQDVSKSSSGGSVNTSQASKNSSAQNTGDFFNFGIVDQPPQNKSPPVIQNRQPSSGVNQDLFSLFDAPVQNSSPIMQQTNQAYIGTHKPLIPSNPNHQQQDPTVQLDMFKNLYTNIQSQPVQPLPQMNTYQQQQQQPNAMMSAQNNNQFMTGYNQFNTGMMQGGMPTGQVGFNQQFMTNSNMIGGQGYGMQQQPNMYNGQMMGNFNQGGGYGTNAQMNPMMMQQQQQQQQQQQFPQGQFMTNQSTYPQQNTNNAQNNQQQQQLQQQNTGKEFTFW